MQPATTGTSRQESSQRWQGPSAVLVAEVRRTKSDGQWRRGSGTGVICVLEELSKLHAGSKVASWSSVG